jgi:hypothetical protein
MSGDDRIEPFRTTRTPHLASPGVSQRSVLATGVTTTTRLLAERRTRSTETAMARALLSLGGRRCTLECLASREDRS